MNDKFTPKQNPPGFTFYSNHGKYDTITKVNWTEESLIEYISKTNNIPKEDIIVLNNVVEGMAFSSFLHERYSAWIKSQWNYVEFMINFFKDKEFEE